MKALFRFLAGPTGRAVRIIAGLILIVGGIWVIRGVGGWIVAVVGLVPFLAGLFDRCVFAPLFGLPFSGESLRRAVSSDEPTDAHQE